MEWNIFTCSTFCVYSTLFKSIQLKTKFWLSQSLSGYTNVSLKILSKRISISSIYWQCKATFVFPHSFERNFDYCIWIIFLDFLSFTWPFENPNWLCRKIQVDWHKSNFQICIQWLKSVSAHILFLQKKEGQRVWRVSRSGFSRFVFRLKE